MYDFNNLRKIPALANAAPEAMDSFKTLDGTALKDGAIPKGAHGDPRSPDNPGRYYLEVHRKAALTAGAIEEELAETVFVAVALRADAALTHGTHITSNE